MRSRVRASILPGRSLRRSAPRSGNAVGILDRTEPDQSDPCFVGFDATVISWIGISRNLAGSAKSDSYSSIAVDCATALKHEAAPATTRHRARMPHAANVVVTWATMLAGVGIMPLHRPIDAELKTIR
jgi:hypothetical protein